MSEMPGGRGAEFAPPADLARLAGRAFMAGTAGAALCALGAALEPAQFFRSYLVAWLFWLGIALGCFAISMLHHLSHGAWGLMIRRVLEAASRTLPLLALLFVPLLPGLGEVYPWAREGAAASDPLIATKAAYLNMPFFVARAVLYFALWAGFALLLARLSLAQDRTGDPRLARRMQAVAAAGLGTFCLTGTFAAVDWLMSLDPHWYSSIFGIYFVGGTGVAAFAFVVPVALFLAGREPMARVFRPQHFHDYGKLLLAFVMLWTYFGLSQLLIIWSGNLPEEVTWYLERSRGGWEWVSVGLALFHFALPLLLLLSRDLKRHARRLAGVALLLLAMRWVDLYWQAAPVFHPEGVSLHWLDLATVVAIGGLWLGFFLRRLGTRSLLPLNDPYLAEAIDLG